MGYKRARLQSEHQVITVTVQSTLVKVGHITPTTLTLSGSSGAGYFQHGIVKTGRSWLEVSIGESTLVLFLLLVQKLRKHFGGWIWDGKKNRWVCLCIFVSRG